MLRSTITATFVRQPLAETVSVSICRLATLPVVPALLALIALPLTPTAVVAQRAQVFGTVYDSLSDRPLADALVQLAPRDTRARVRTANTDSQGRFQLRSVRPGEYLVGLLHPSLDSMGLEIPPRRLVIDENTAQIQLALAIPTQLAIRAQLYPAVRPADSSGVLLGYIRDANSGVRLDGASVDLDWTELVLSKDGIHADHKTATAPATKGGWYAFCGISTAGPVSARGKLGSNASGFIDVRIPPRGILHRDFSIPIGAAAIAVAPTDSGDTTANPLRRGSARVAGVVRNDKGKPLAGAQLLVWGSGITATSRDDGSFSLAELPAGTQTVESRFVGYSPKRIVVDLMSDRTVQVAIAMTEHVDVLDEMTVYSRNDSRSKQLAGFLQRQKSGIGHFITRADIEKTRPLRFTDLLRSTPGIRIVPTGGLEYAIVSSHGGAMGGPCQALIYINGIRLVNPSGLDMMVEPNEVAAVEVYSGISETPPQFQGGPRGACGSIAIWTGPNLPLLGSQP